MNRLRITFLFLGLFFLSLTSLAERHDDRGAVKSCLVHYAALGESLGINYLPHGPKITLAAPVQGTRPIESIEKLKVGTYNVFNLEEHQAKMVFDPVQNKMVEAVPPIAKPAWQLDGVAETIQRADPDILFLQEVESLSALKALTEERLGGKYRLLLIEGNDSRGIDIAALVKKDLPFDLEMQSYRNHRSPSLKDRNQTDYTFSRDLPVLTIREKGKKTPLMDFIGTHFKSQRDSPQDPKGINKRAQQARVTKQIHDNLRTTRPDSPIVLLGDFNSHVPSSKEFEPLWAAGFRDSFDLTQAPMDARVTHSFHPKGGDTVYNQLDSVSVSAGDPENLVESAQVMRYLDGEGKPKPLPQTFNERKQNPSDHMMVVVEMDFRQVYKPAP